jgi:hypothetical protein
MDKKLFYYHRSRELFWLKQAKNVRENKNICSDRAKKFLKEGNKRYAFDYFALYKSNRDLEQRCLSNFRKNMNLRLTVALGR